MPINQPIAEVRAWLTLLRVPGFGASVIRQRVAQHRTAAVVLANAKRDAQISDAARAWFAQPDEALIDSDLAWLDAPRHYLITIADDDYPALLMNGQNPPAALYVAGEPTSLWMPQIAIVGSRRASSGGLENARAFARTFVQAGNAVTSGLAEGIDGAAHTAALDAGGVTIAVLGTGPDMIYPRQHASLAERIVEHGALVSEFPPGTAGRPEFFPRRNRIIAGLSLGTLVVEAGLKSGSLITARLANEQGREVFALPGSIHNPMARGCHQLIREGAKLIETAAEILDELHGVGALLADDLRRRLDSDETRSLAAVVSNRCDDPDYVKLLAALDAQPLALDELADRTQLSAAALSSMLLMLELDSVVVAENGRYARR
ncbi:MAG TPA: DNA-processing protein DprA [Rudaea sp.]|jgi:DNA processing protein|nr:DNA-processing protein DprA [Rudaea sp.]